jgi:hypothetical protein
LGRIRSLAQDCAIAEWKAAVANCMLLRVVLPCIHEQQICPVPSLSCRNWFELVRASIRRHLEQNQRYFLSIILSLKVEISRRIPRRRGEALRHAVFLSETRAKFLKVSTRHRFQQSILELLTFQRRKCFFQAAIGPLLHDEDVHDFVRPRKLPPPRSIRTYCSALCERVIVMRQNAASQGDGQRRKKYLGRLSTRVE